MLEIDQITIIAGIIILVLTLASSLMNPYLFRVKIPGRTARRTGSAGHPENSQVGKDDQKDRITVSPENSQSGISPEPIQQVTSPSSEKSEDQPVSIIITPHDEKDELERNLPLFLYQDYGADFQIIVVAEAHESDTEDVLKKLKQQFGNRLYYTMIPDSSRYMSRKKLQITLGVKAAKYEWILLTSPTCRPESSSWLKAVSKYRTQWSDFVMGITVYDHNASSYQRFEHLYTALPLIYQARHGNPYRTNMPYICFRKSEFFKGEGFRDNLELIHGEYDFMVNKYALVERTEIALERESWLTEDAPTERSWQDMHLSYYATRKKLKHSWVPRIKSYWNQLLLHISLIADILVMIWSGLTYHWVLLGTGGVALLICLIVRWTTGRMALHPYDDTVPVFCLPFYELSLVWRSLFYRLHYLTTDKSHFTSHKL
ncbi:MAG: glycosyl transferase family 2 [Prevotella sp.]|jgi:hypothetical protein|nr:glycosyl transferase family 2 [Prevotella sp.]MCH3993569.1 glycosyl transferase family 2 [Prevotella sp.]